MTGLRFADTNIVLCSTKGDHRGSLLRSSGGAYRPTQEEATVSLRRSLLRNTGGGHCPTQQTP